jgi:TPR repeat protein
MKKSVFLRGVVLCLCCGVLTGPVMAADDPFAVPDTSLLKEEPRKSSAVPSPSPESVPIEALQQAVAMPPVPLIRDGRSPFADAPETEETVGTADRVSAAAVSASIKPVSGSGQEQTAQSGEPGAAQLLCGMENSETAATRIPTEQAFKMLADLAEKGNADAMNGLGSFYFRGLGVEKDDVLATRWFAKAAEKGQVQAMYSLGCCSYQGHGVPKDMAAALRWFTRAGEQGHAEGAYNAGVLHATGQGTPADKGKARTWYQTAAGLGSVEARARLGADVGGK